MKFIKSDIANIFLYDTKIENLFINEYMLAAPGEYVKVYLLGCMFAESNMPIDNELLAKQLNISEEEVEKAWRFWENNHVVRINGKGENQTIEILNLKEEMFGSPVGSREKDLSDQSLEEVFDAIEKNWGMVLDANELEQIASWQEFYNISPEFLVFAITYCAEKDKKNVRYLEKVIQGWLENKCETVEDIQNYLNEVDQKYYKYKRVMQALGFARNATEVEKRIMDEWFDQLKFTMDKVLSACEKTSGISNPNLNYVNKVLQNWAKEARQSGVDVNKKTIDRSTLNEYLQYLRDKENTEAEERKLEVYKKIPRIKKIDSDIAELGAKMSQAVIAGDKELGSKIKAEIDDLIGERAFTLTENNYEIDYTDVKYSCDICKDTGITDEGEKCQCMGKRMEEAEAWVNLEKKK